MRVFVDSSTMIALARIGELGFLKEMIGEVCITSCIEKEILSPGFPETAAIEKAVGDWILIVPLKGNAGRFRKYGLGEGESSLFLAENKDILVIDELNARRLAEAEGRPFTGLLGLIVAAAESGSIGKDRARSMVDRLSESSFRMSATLYRDIVRRLDYLE
jgi:predicted nucleic acid-binding protein